MTYKDTGHLSCIMVHLRISPRRNTGIATGMATVIATVMAAGVVVRNHHQRVRHISDGVLIVVEVATVKRLFVFIGKYFSHVPEIVLFLC